MIAKRKLLSVSPYQAWIGLLAALILAGVVAGILVFINGLVITNLSDQTPWGLWITIDLSAIALSAGAFTLCAGVYLLGLQQFKSLARTAAFIGLVGYSMAMLCLLLDIGRPDRFYYGFLHWNPHSVLWEVTMCVGLYFGVLVMENLSTIAHWAWLRSRFPKLVGWMTKAHDYAPYLAVAGLLLSILHQSSLGATYGVLIARPIWFRPGLAGLFFVSAVAGGTAMTMLVTLVAGMIRPAARSSEQTLDQLARFLGWLLLGYLYLRSWDLLAMTYTFQPGRAEGFSLLTQRTLSFNLWFGEILFGILVPAILLLRPRFRQQKMVLLTALVMVVGGLVAFRWDTNMVGQLVVQSPVSSAAAPLYTSYSPSLVEVLAGAGIIAFGLLAITFGIRYLNLAQQRAA